MTAGGGIVFVVSVTMFVTTQHYGRTVIAVVTKLSE